jgi:hypothetical protein
MHTPNDYVIKIELQVGLNDIVSMLIFVNIKYLSRHLLCVKDIYFDWPCVEGVPHDYHEMKAYFNKIYK